MIVVVCMAVMIVSHCADIPMNAQVTLLPDQSTLCCGALIWRESEDPLGAIIRHRDGAFPKQGFFRLKAFDHLLQHRLHVFRCIAQPTSPIASHMSIRRLP